MAYVMKKQVWIIEGRDDKGNVIYLAKGWIGTPDKARAWEFDDKTRAERIANLFKNTEVIAK